MIHINQLRAILKSGKPFDCRVWTLNGEILDYKNVVCTSTFNENGTANLKFINSGSIRKVHVIYIWEVNDNEIYI